MLRGVTVRPALQVALKRQQAAEDAIAMGLRAVATGSSCAFLPPGPIFGMNMTQSQSAEQTTDHGKTTAPQTMVS